MSVELDRIAQNIKDGFTSVVAETVISPSIHNEIVDAITNKLFATSLDRAALATHIDTIEARLAAELKAAKGAKKTKADDETPDPAA